MSTPVTPSAAPAAPPASDDTLPQALRKFSKDAKWEEYVSKLESKGDIPFDAVTSLIKLYTAAVPVDSKQAFRRFIELCELADGFIAARSKDALKLERELYDAIQHALETRTTQFLDDDGQPRVVIVNSGGTLASKKKDDGLWGQPDRKEKFLLKELNKHHEFQNLVGETRDSRLQLVPLPHTIDSSCAVPEDWMRIASAVARQIVSAHVRGVVVVHGTDTLAYSAAAVTFLLKDVPKPVVFTASQLPIAAVGSDAVSNLYGAVCVAFHGHNNLTIPPNDAPRDSFKARSSFSASPTAAVTVGVASATVGQVGDQKDDQKQKVTSMPNFRDVCVYFAHKLFRSTRLEKVNSTGFQAFDTPRCEPIAVLEGTQFRFDEYLTWQVHTRRALTAHWKTKPGVSKYLIELIGEKMLTSPVVVNSLSAIQKSAVGYMDLFNLLDAVDAAPTFQLLKLKSQRPTVASFRLVPGNYVFETAEWMKPTKAGVPTIDGVVLEAHGCGNGPDDSESLFRKNLCALLEHNKPVVVVTECRNGFVEVEYAAGLGTIESSSKKKVIMCKDMSFPTAYAKLIVLLWETPAAVIDHYRTEIGRNSHGEHAEAISLDSLTENTPVAALVSALLKGEKPSVLQLLVQVRDTIDKIKADLTNTNAQP